jgi:hypothetical protein
MGTQAVVSVDSLKLKPDRETLAPPWLATPYRCATAVTIYGFVPHATVDIEIDGTVTLSAVVEFPEPVGATLALPALLNAGEVIRVRQHGGSVVSAWSAPVTVVDHTQEYPAGPPRPQISPAPLYRCGSRTGVDNLLGGGNVLITADGVEVGRIDGCGEPRQGVNINPFFGLDQRVRAHFELCGDRSAPSLEHVTIPGPAPLPAPGFDQVYAGSEQVRITNIANGARASVIRNGTALGIWRCWGGALLLGVSPVSAGETFNATQELCTGDPSSPPGTVTAQPCSALPAPAVGPLQAGDMVITVTSCVPGAVISVFRNLVQVGQGAAPRVALTQAVAAGDVVHVVQSLAGCVGRLALEVRVACVDPAVTDDPVGFDVYAVGHDDYADGPVKGSVYYPAEDDGAGQPFSARLASAGRVPIVFMAHGNHDPADPSYLGYDYFQHDLAKMGIVAVSVDCNALNGASGGVGNIEDRADLIIDSIAHFQGLDANPASVFHGRLDFGRVGLMGHSRGGDAIVTLPAVIALPGVTIRSGLALAPTNFRYWSGLSTIRPSGYAFMTILPAADGDVVDNNGAQFYDQAEPGPYKSQLYVHSTNHNFFNRQWLLDDGVTAAVSRGTHERVLEAYGCALFRHTLLGHATREFLDGRALPAAVPTALVYRSFELAGQSTVDHHEDANGIAVNSMGQPTTQSGGMVADEYAFDRVATAFNDSFFGLTTGMVMWIKESGALFRSAVEAVDARQLEVWIRAAEVAAGALPTVATGFELGLEDASGMVAWVDSDSVGGLARPFARPDVTKTMLQTLRFRTACFVKRPNQLDLRRIVAILIRYNRPVRGPALAFDDLQLVQVS